MMLKNKEQICPKCKSVYSEYPSLSREDNETLICPTCSLKEALDVFVKVSKITEPTSTDKFAILQERIADRLRKTDRSAAGVSPAESAYQNGYQAALEAVLGIMDELNNGSS